MEIPLKFLDAGVKYTATVYSDRNPDDASDKAVKIETMGVDSATVLKADIAANGGEAIRIVPAGGEPLRP
jgi:alpha-glucosidase